MIQFAYDIFQNTTTAKKEVYVLYFCNCYLIIVERVEVSSAKKNFLKNRTATIFYAYLITFN